MLRFLISSVLLLSPSIALGDFILSGDSNNLDAIDGSFGSLPNGNSLFFTNLLGSGKSVEIYGGSNDAESAGILNTLYNSLPGVNSIIESGSITSLAGVSLLVIDLPDAVLSTPEITLVKTFQATGGNVLFVGENSGFYNISLINSDLTAVGSTMQLVAAVADPGINYATIANHQILSDSLTVGVDNYVYGGGYNGGTSLVSGGKALFLTKEGSSFFSVERTAVAVPEPSSFLLITLGIGCTIGRFIGYKRPSPGIRQDNPEEQ